MKSFKQMLKDRKMFKRFMLFYDIETFQFNEKEGKEKPSKYKNMTFSVAISWIENGQVEYEVFPSFKEPFDLIIETYSTLRKKPVIELNGHNSNKYDNHFLRRDLLYYYPDMKIANYFLMTATTEKSNENSLRLKDLANEDKEGIILEKRIKSSINLEMIIFIKGVRIETVDNWVKTNSSVAMLGRKLKRLGVVSDDELKTDFNYTKYNLENDLTELQAREYAKEIFDNLSDDEITYIQNDVILLAKSVYYYADLFNGFDYSKMTFTSNILESYNTNDLTSFQLLNRIGQGKEKQEVRYTDYIFSNRNFYDYLKNFYRGGLNFYNQFHIGKHIKTGVFGMDIHSSYPYAMHNFKIPTYLKDFEQHDQPKEMKVNLTNDEYSLYELSKETFDTIILDKIESIVFKQMLVKYYTTNEFININSYTFRMLKDILGLEFETIPAYSRVTFETKYFGSREQIAEFYRIKTQGDTNKKIIYKSPYDIQLTNEENKELLSPEEYDNSKVVLNGLYGIPALRPYFNLFRLNEQGEYINIENGHKNAERNIVFSIFVTSVSLWNLLNPLKYLTEKEIDENFLYCDTDSLYFKQQIKHKIPDSLFTKYALGTWDLEHDNLPDFYVLNHKKYAFSENGEIKIRAGGIPRKSFNTDLPFSEFIKTQFSDGVKLKTLTSIYNEQETISIYESITKLEIGKGYRIISNNSFFDSLKEKMLEEVKSSYSETIENNALYIESEIGTFSISDLYPVIHETDDKRKLEFLQIRQNRIRNRIE